MQSEFFQKIYALCRHCPDLIAHGIAACLQQQSVYNLLHRHDWRKLVPNKRHVKADPVAQEAWKKTPANYQRFELRLAERAATASDVSRRGSFWTDFSR
jgi:hypothetical protein